MGNGVINTAAEGEFVMPAHPSRVQQLTVLATRQWAYEEVQVLLAQMRAALRDPKLHAYYNV
jgi:hypothetical protein